jgi:hypothetical protein
MIDELFDRAWTAEPAADAKPTPHALPAESLDSQSYSQGRFIDPAQARSISGWTLEVPEWKTLPGSKRGRFTSLPMFCASAAGAEATLEFTGTAIGAFITAGPDAGIVEVSIDGGPATMVDTRHRFSQGLHYPRTVMFATDLPPGKHVLTMKVAEKTSGNGHAIRIMQFVAN